MWVLQAGLLSVLISLTSGDLYVQSGSDIRVCNMKCSNSSDKLRLTRTCGRQTESEHLLLLYCDNMTPSNNYERISLDTKSGCWTLTDAGINDSCVYNIRNYSASEEPLTSTIVSVLDPVVVSNIANNGTQLGQDIALSLAVTGEETTVIWEVDGGPLPDRYQLVNDNKTLIIHNAQREEGGRNIRVRISNPVSEETREHQLEVTGIGMTSTGFPVPHKGIGMTSTEFPVPHKGIGMTSTGFPVPHKDSGRSHPGTIFTITAFVTIAFVVAAAAAVIIYFKCYKNKSARHGEKNGTIQNGSPAPRVQYTRAPDTESAEGGESVCVQFPEEKPERNGKKICQSSISEQGPHASLERQILIHANGHTIPTHQDQISPALT